IPRSCVGHRPFLRPGMCGGQEIVLGIKQPETADLTDQVVICVAHAPAGPGTWTPAKRAQERLVSTFVNGDHSGSPPGEPAEQRSGTSATGESEKCGRLRINDPEAGPRFAES